MTDLIFRAPLPPVGTPSAELARAARASFAGLAPAQAAEGVAEANALEVYHRARHSAEAADYYATVGLVLAREVGAVVQRPRGRPRLGEQVLLPDLQGKTRQLYALAAEPTVEEFEAWLDATAAKTLPALARHGAGLRKQRDRETGEEVRAPAGGPPAGVQEDPPGESARLPPGGDSLPEIEPGALAEATCARLLAEQLEADGRAAWIDHGLELLQGVLDHCDDPPPTCELAAKEAAHRARVCVSIFLSLDPARVAKESA